MAIRTALGADAPVWACLSTSGMRALEIPDTVRELIIAGDHDAQARGRDGKWRQPGDDAARALVGRLEGTGVVVRIADPGRGRDFNDLPQTG